MFDDKYAYRIIWSEEDGEWIGLCAEFPSLNWLGKTQDEAFAGIRKLVGDVVADMDANGERLPDPISRRRYSGKFMVRVPPDVHRDLAMKAAEANVSLNRLVSAKLSE